MGLENHQSRKYVLGIIGQKHTFISQNPHLTNRSTRGGVLGYPSVSERLNIVSELIQRREDLHEYLELQRRVLQAQLETDATSDKGARSGWNDQVSLALLEQRSLVTKRPIVHFLDPAIFDVDSLISVFRRVVESLISIHPEKKGLRGLLDHIDDEKIDFMKLMEAALREDEASIMSCAGKFGVEPSLLLFLVTTSIQPFIEEFSRRVSPSFFDRWWRAHCPVCGRIPVVARIRNRRRYLMCDFCGAEYLSDYFLCVNCGNIDPYTLKYMRIEGKPGFQIDFCTKCKHYIKVIIEDALREPIPRCVEDILTLDLDVEAKHAGLMRNG